MVFSYIAPSSRARFLIRLHTVPVFLVHVLFSFGAVSWRRRSGIFVHTHGDRLVDGGGDPVLLHVGGGVLAFLFHVPVVVEVGAVCYRRLLWLG
jgi:hypothetical protein